MPTAIATQLDFGYWEVRKISNNTLVAHVWVSKIESEHSTPVELAVIEHWFYADKLDPAIAYKLQRPDPAPFSNFEDVYDDAVSNSWKYIPAFCPLPKQL